MHPKTRDVRRPDPGIDPRGSGAQPPLLQGYLKHGKRAAPPAMPPAGPAAKPVAKEPRPTPKG